MKTKDGNGNGTEIGARINLEVVTPNVIIQLGIGLCSPYTEIFRIDRSLLPLQPTKCATCQTIIWTKRSTNWKDYFSPAPCMTSMPWVVRATIRGVHSDCMTCTNRRAPQPQSSLWLYNYAIIEPEINRKSTEMVKIADSSRFHGLCVRSSSEFWRENIHGGFATLVAVLFVFACHCAKRFFFGKPSGSSASPVGLSDSDLPTSGSRIPPHRWFSFWGLPVLNWVRFVFL